MKKKQTAKQKESPMLCDECKKKVNVLTVIPKDLYKKLDKYNIKKCVCIECLNKYAEN